MSLCHHLSIATIVQTLSVYLMAICIMQQHLLNGAVAARRVRKRFIIHVPIRIKTHHHTHTVYSHVQSSGGTKQTIYKILGYAAHDNNYGHAHTPGHGYALGHGHGHGHGYKHDDTLYDDFHSGGPACDTHPHGDMVFNHYARNSDVAYDDVDDDGVDDVAVNGDYEYPDVDEYVNKHLDSGEWT